MNKLYNLMKFKSSGIPSNSAKEIKKHIKLEKISRVYPMKVA